jgi:hypothetical protein
VPSAPIRRAIVALAADESRVRQDYAARSQGKPSLVAKTASPAENDTRRRERRTGLMRHRTESL